MSAPKLYPIYAGDAETVALRRAARKAGVSPRYICAVATSEKRVPRVGEWFLFPGRVPKMAYFCNANNILTRRIIARLVIWKTETITDIVAVL